MTTAPLFTFPPSDTGDWILVSIPLMAAVIWYAYTSANAETDTQPSLRNRMGLTALPEPLFVIGIAIWAALFAILIAGLFWIVFTTATDTETYIDKEKARWSLFRLTGLTAVTGAVVALPFTLLRTTYNKRQTDAAESSLLNEKLNAAYDGLTARHTVTKPQTDENGIVTILSEQTDDIVTRAIAIERLEQLANLDPTQAPAIASILALYVRELSHEFQAKPVPSDDPTEIRKWGHTLRIAPKRSDMQKAAQTLGRIRKIKGVNDDAIKIDLNGANLQGFDLYRLTFKMDDLSGAKLQGADLRWAQLQGADLSMAKLQGADLSGAQLQGAYLSGAKLQGADLSRAKLQGADLGMAQLQGADLSWAKLQEADLSGAQLQGANLSEAKLQGAYLSLAKFDTLTTLTAATLRGAAVKVVDYNNIPQILPFLDDIFGDASTTLPNGITPTHPNWPPHWPKFVMNWKDYYTELEKWRTNPTDYTPPTES